MVFRKCNSVKTAFENLLESSYRRGKNSHKSKVRKYNALFFSSDIGLVGKANKKGSWTTQKPELQTRKQSTDTSVSTTVRTQHTRVHIATRPDCTTGPCATGLLSVRPGWSWMGHTAPSVLLSEVEDEARPKLK